ncbi:hypothetical protein FDA94_17445 [Herbidospora galbida]|uniref:Uncharacterized protein n=1 Tax=Herbidospora galbida TaxID=2575442 RepID=A0A4U3MI50_9ACTN|nr:hypothetical protein [Herbidospora galbida]TKK87606.1 hypothetical protein FDA94_17445 [Herbidospora galbida]
MKKWDRALWKLLFMVTGMAMLPAIGIGVADYVTDGAQRVASREYLLPRIILFGGWWIFLLVMVIRFSGRSDEPE